MKRQRRDGIFMEKGKKQNNRAVGAAYEKRAGEYLKSQGYHILEYNYRCRMGEIDIVARKETYLVFVEVKYRRRDGQGHPAESVTLAKQRKISKVAQFYCLTHGLTEGVPCRFDVVSILGDATELIENAFEYRA